MGSKNCDDCQRPITFRKIDGRLAPVNEGSREDHRLTCTGDAAKAWRIRRRKEDGWYPTSPSAIKTYLECPTRYYDLYTDEEGRPRIPDRENPEGALGTAFHRYVAARLRGEAPPAGQLIPFEYVREYLEMVATWERHFAAGKFPVDGAAVEDSLLHEWEDVSGMRVQLRVIADRWFYEGFGRTSSVDWKTGWDTPSLKELWKDPQAVATAVAIRHHPDLEGAVEEVRFTLWLARHNGQPCGPVVFTRDLLDAYEDALHRVVARIVADEEFKPNPYCDVCPPGRHDVHHRYAIKVAGGGEVTIEPPQTPAQAEELAHVARGAKRLERAAMGALRPYTAKHGPVLGIGHHSHTSLRVVDPEKFRTFLIEEGEEGRLSRWMAVSGNRMKSLKDAQYLAELRAKALAQGLIFEATESKYEVRDEKPEGLVIDTVAVPDEQAPELPSARPVFRVLQEGDEA